MRVVGGRFRGRQLAAPGDHKIRPTSDRVREAVFNVLAHGMEGSVLEGSAVLDLFAGTGAFGIEALSRGAASCLFVEEDPEARGLIRRNIESLGLTGVTKIYRRNATDLGDAGNRQPFQLIFADPPYAKGLGEKALASAGAGGWIADGAIVLLEERADVVIGWPPGFEAIDHRSWGDTQVSFARFRSGRTSAGATR